MATLGAGNALAACSGDDSSTQGHGSSGGDGIQLVSSDSQRVAGDQELLPEVARGLRTFAGGLYQGVASEQSGNLVLSPYSVLVALGMTLAGAGGTTADEMRTVLGVGKHGDRWHAGLNALTAHIDSLAGTQKRRDGSKAEVEFATANQIFGQRDVAWEKQFVDLLAEQYGAPLRAVDYADDAEGARTLINGWVEEQTNDKIVDLIPKGVLSELTRMVLVNALHLKAPWETPFDKSSTKDGPFHRPDGQQIRVPLMHKSSVSASLATGDGWQAAVLPYAGGKLSMAVVVPSEDRFDEVESTLSETAFVQAAMQARPTLLDLTLPRWELSSAAALNDILAALGMPMAFDERAADFTPMTDEDLDLHVDSVLHKGFIAVDEEGTEAAAATSVAVGDTSVPIVEEFVVDRPFLFAIHDVEFGVPLFVGRVLDPSS